MLGLPFLDIFSRILLIFIVIYYLITNLQWYNYSFYRVLTKHHKIHWHFYYLIIPLLMFFILTPFYSGFIFFMYLYLVALPMFILWCVRIDKKLVWTKRILRFFGITLVFTLLSELIIYDYGEYLYYKNILIFIPLIFSFILSTFCEYILFKKYARLASDKIAKATNLTIIAITGSYGKTSIKNFIYEILKTKYITYATPRSVNTYKGLVRDINQNLDSKTQIYIAEAGARSMGDIADISNLLQRHYAVISKIGKSHIEYFKDIQNTIQTKFEILYSNRLIRAFSHIQNKLPMHFHSEFSDNLENIKKYPLNIRNINANLDYTSFEMQIDSKWEIFKTLILGKFNVDNIAVAILMAIELQIDIDSIKEAVANLTPVAHRLNKILSAQKIILDDSFNGNLEGMKEAIRLSSLHKGRKVIVTPGLVEYDENSNIEICKEIDRVFDLVIITGDLNATLFNNNITISQKIMLKDKSELENVLSKSGRAGDLVLFANDAPNYI